MVELRNVTGLSIMRQTEFDMHVNVSWCSLRLHLHIKVSVSCIFLLCIYKHISMEKKEIDLLCVQISQ